MLGCNGSSRKDYVHRLTPGRDFDGLLQLVESRTARKISVSTDMSWSHTDSRFAQFGRHGFEILSLL